MYLQNEKWQNCEFLSIFVTKDRSSHQRCSVKKGVLKNFEKFTGKHLCQSLFLRHRRFPANFAKFLRTLFLTEDLWMTASKKAHYKMKLRVNELQKEAVAGNCSEKTKRSSKFCKIYRKCQKQANKK